MVCFNNRFFRFIKNNRKHFNLKKLNIMDTKRAILMVMNILFVATGYAYADGNKVIKGTLLDAENQKPLPYANVTLYYNSDSSLVKGVTTQMDGEFVIKNIPGAEYYMKVSFMGYGEKVIPEIHFGKGQQVYNLGKIQMKQESKSLEEVFIKAYRIKGKDKTDRTVYNLNNKIKSVSSDGLDVLGKIPEVTVDVFDKVTIEGNSNILFTVNDVERDKDYVAQLTPKQIDRVEVITNPSVKYDAGISSVINIVLTDKVNYGLQGQIKGAVPTPDAVIINPMVNLEYGRKNIRLYARNRTHYENFTGLSEVKNIQFRNNNTWEQDKDGEGNLTFGRNTLNAGIDWFIDEQNTVNFNVKSNLSGMKQEDFTMGQRTYENDQLMSKSDIGQDDTEDGTNMYYSLYWKNDFDQEGQKIIVETGFYDGITDQILRYKHTNLDLNTREPLETYQREEYVSNENSNIPLKIDYEQTFDNIKLETGYKGLYEWYDNELSTSHSDATVSTFKYDEMRHAGYVNFSGSINKWKLQAGLRAEYSGIDIDNEAENNYLCFLPQASVYTKFKNAQTLKINYRRRIFRPRMSDLRPIEQWSDSMHVHRGNPALDPAYSNRMELAYSKNIKSNFIKPKVYAEYTINGFHDISYINENGVTETTVDNIGKAWEYGFSLTGALQPAEWLKLNANATVYNRRITSESDLSVTEEPQQKWSYRTNVSAIISPYKDWNLLYNLRYSSPHIDYQRTNYRDMMMVAGIQKNILENLKVELLSMIPTSDSFTYRRHVTRTPEVYRETAGSVNFNFIAMLGVTWNFDYGKKIKKLERSMENKDKGSKGAL